jgi:hypothetical protein
MANLRRSGAALAASILMSLSTFTPASGSVPPASDPPSPVGVRPTTSTTYKTVPSAFSLMISPTRLVVGRADIGTVQKVQVINRGQSPVSVTVQKRNFTGSRDGALVFQEHAQYSASDWVTVKPLSFTVAPGAMQVVSATITVPTAPEPGDHQVVLVFLVPSGKTSGNIKINRGIGTPVYVTVPGPIDDSASLSDLHAPGFATGGPVTLTATVRNTGTVHRDFRGATALKIHSAGAAAAFPDFTVIRGVTRDISTTWDPPLICICNPTVTFVNAAGSVQSSSVRVIVFPLPLLGLSVGALLVLWVVTYLARRRYQASVTKAAALLSRPVGTGDV